MLSFLIFISVRYLFRRDVKNPNEMRTKPVLDIEEKKIIIDISEIESDGVKSVKLEFSDNGMGIEDYRKEKIFEVGNREFKGERGMGLGLSLVKKTVESFGGKIWVEDKIQGDYLKGSNFIIIFPKN